MLSPSPLNSSPEISMSVGTVPQRSEQLLGTHSTLGSLPMVWLSQAAIECSPPEQGSNNVPLPGATSRSACSNQVSDGPKGRIRSLELQGIVTFPSQYYRELESGVLKHLVSQRMAEEPHCSDPNLELRNPLWLPPSCGLSRPDHLHNHPCCPSLPSWWPAPLSIDPPVIVHDSIEAVRDGQHSAVLKLAADDGLDEVIRL